MVLAFLIVVFILLMQFLWRYIDDLVGKGLDSAVIGEFMFWAMLTVIPMALPLSMLFASIMTMGNLGGNNELLAMKSAGLSLVRILRPMFFVALLVTVFAFYVADNVLPHATMKISSLLWDIKNKRPDANIIPGVFSAIDDNVIKVASKHPKTNKMTDIMLYQHPEGKGNISLIVADSGYIKSDEENMYVTLYNGVSYDDATYSGFNNPKNSFSFQKRTFDKYVLIVDLSKSKLQRSDSELFRGQFATMKSAELSHIIDSVSVLQKIKIDVFWTEYSQSQSLDSRGEIDTMVRRIDGYENKLSKTIDIDSVYKAFSRQQKADALRYALDKARSASTAMNMNTTEIMINETNIRKADVAWNNKYVMSIACFIFFLIGAPFGAIIRKGGLGMPTVASLLIFITYYIMLTIASKMALQGAFPVIYAMWFSNALFLPLGIFFMIKAKNDSALFDKESYVKYLKTFKVVLAILGVRFNAKIEDDGKNYYKPSTINNSAIDKKTLIDMFDTFATNVTDLLEKVKLSQFDESNIKDFNKRYDNILSILWGIDDDSLQGLLKDYPMPLDLSILKSETLSLQMIQPFLITKLEQIEKNNRKVGRTI